MTKISKWRRFRIGVAYRRHVSAVHWSIGAVVERLMRGLWWQRLVLCDGDCVPVVATTFRCRFAGLGDTVWQRALNRFIYSLFTNSSSPTTHLHLPPHLSRPPICSHSFTSLLNHHPSLTSNATHRNSPNSLKHPNQPPTHPTPLN